MLKEMLGRKGEVRSKVGPLWKIDVLKGFLGKKRCLGRKWGLWGKLTFWRDLRGGKGALE